MPWQQKLMIGIQASHEAHPLKPRYRVNTPRPKSHHMLRARGEPVPFRLSKLPRSHENIRSELQRRMRRRLAHIPVNGHEQLTNLRRLGYRSEMPDRHRRQRAAQVDSAVALSATSCASRAARAFAQS